MKISHDRSLGERLRLGPAGCINTLSACHYLRNIDPTVNGCYVSDMKQEALPVRFEMRASDQWIKAVDDWRRQQPDLPSRAEAIRRLVEAALKR